MIKIIARALGFLGLDRVHLAVYAGILLGFVALYGWGAVGRADLARERDALTIWADATCASAQIEFRPREGKPGEACRARILALAQHEKNIAVESARILAEAATDREARAAKDGAMARQSAADARAAAETMEKANAGVSGDVVAGDWFRALNRVGGLRPVAH